MNVLTRADLLSLEDYARQRAAFRSRVLAHKKNRRVSIGPHAALYFEDRLTVQYQIQEMLRIERIFEPEGIAAELAAYNPLIPDGDNWKATFMLEYPDPAQRREWLKRLLGIENNVWVKVGDGAAVRALADEDLARATAEKTSAVHFLRFQLEPEMIAAAKEGAAVAVGVDHDEYACCVDPLPEPVRASLVADLGPKGRAASL
ncbi:MAG TPA: DUF3501 family protein [Gammaproteobacteria bacterium]|nr:DUF3501 family protein [Gammaproteobacteria bacterium]